MPSQTPHRFLVIGRCLHLVVTILLTAAAAPAAHSAGDTASFGNTSISFDWRVVDSNVTGVRQMDSASGAGIAIGAPFLITLKDGTKLGLEQLVLTNPPHLGSVPGDPRASRAAARGGTARATFDFADGDGRFRIEWRLMQPHGATYLRQELDISALKQDESIARVDFLQAVVPGAAVIGKVKGSPIVAGRRFWMLEHPLSQSMTRLDGSMRLWIERTLPLQKGQTISYSAAAGVTPAGQMRRGFHEYLEAERAHPYRTFLHYNSWYDIGYFTPYTQSDALERIAAFGRELHERRGVTLDSFLFDDGWDDRSGRWGFSKDFRDGFKPVRDAAANVGAAPGVWLSPWGGYGPPKAARIAAGQQAGLEIVDGGFALSGPRYYEQFRDVTLQLVREHGINQFKLDGTGNADRVFPGSRFDSDFDAAIALIADLRQAKPDLFINLTTGTYPSPAWLRYADSIWRDGDDHDFAGVGTRRQQWITYRDRETFENIVVAGPLFPLNALMLHGLIYAQHAKFLNDDPGHDFAAEVHSYFGSGTALQEMYITPSLLSAGDWDTLAEAARWSRANADVLQDTHWVGGDPGRLDVYGWAAWTPRKAIITLRNPDMRPQRFILDAARELELPAGAVRAFRVSSPWRGSAKPGFAVLRADQPVTVSLQPMQVMTLELVPRK